MFKAAIVGCGDVSEVHAVALKTLPGVELVAVADPDRSRAEKRASIAGAAVYTDIEELLQAEQLDAIHLCTPHCLHVPHAVAALERGLSVLTEKPCAITPDSLAQLRAAAAGSAGQLGVCFQNRYLPAARTLRKIIETAEYGRLKSARAFVTWHRNPDYYQKAPWRGTLAQAGGGVMTNQAIHTLDLLLHLGGPLESIDGIIGTQAILPGVVEVEDTAAMRMRFENGAQAVMYATLNNIDNPPVMLELTLERATLRLEGERLYSVSRDGLTAMPLPAIDSPLPDKSYWGRGHALLIADFYDCLKNGRPFTLNAEEGGRASQAVMALYDLNQGLRKN